MAKRDQERNAKTQERDRLAKLGASGVCSGNTARDLFRNMGKIKLAPAKYMRVPIKHKILGRGRPSYPFLLPHELFSTIFHHYPEAFKKVIAPPGETEKFWDQVKGGIWVKYIGTPLFKKTHHACNYNNLKI